MINNKTKEKTKKKEKVIIKPERRYPSPIKRDKPSIKPNPKA